MDNELLFLPLMKLLLLVKFSPPSLQRLHQPVPLTSNIIFMDEEVDPQIPFRALLGVMNCKSLRKFGKKHLLEEVYMVIAPKRMD